MARVEQLTSKQEMVFDALGQHESVEALSQTTWKSLQMKKLRDSIICWQSQISHCLKGLKILNYQYA